MSASSISHDLPRRGRALVPVAAIVVALALSGDAQAHATTGPVSCGATITRDTTLKADLTNCPGDGLVIGADNITLDLNGHTIDGTVAQSSTCDEPPFGNAGIKLGGHDGLTIEDGTVQQFVHGIAGGGEGEGVADSDFHRLVLRDNRVSGLSLGSDQRLNNHNRIVDNEAYGNGCSAGIFLNSADGNYVARNRLHDNDGGIGICCSSDNLVEDNVAAHNRDTGIAVYFGRHSHNVLRDNTVYDNADGIFVGFQEGTSQDDVIADNHSYGNSNAAIGFEDAAGNQVTGNRLDHSGFGVLVFGDANTIARNRVTDIANCPDPATPCGVGIAVAVGADNVIQGNHVARVMSDGIAVVAFNSGSATTGTVVRANLVRAAQRDGYSVGALGQGTVSGTLLAGNLALGAGDDGFDVHLPGTTLAHDLAFHNGDLGIDAVTGTIDGGANKARANGNPAQCAGVTCS
jgi:parallel beta-helix repeat protein